VKVYIVLEHPDMTYYGDGEIHAVETSREAAAAIARDKTAEMHMPEWQDSEWDQVVGAAGLEAERRTVHQRRYDAEPARVCLRDDGEVGPFQQGERPPGELLLPDMSGQDLGELGAHLDDHVRGGGDLLHGAAHGLGGGHVPGPSHAMLRM